MRRGRQVRGRRHLHRGGHRLRRHGRRGIVAHPPGHRGRPARLKPCIALPRHRAGARSAHRQGQGQTHGHRSGRRRGAQPPRQMRLNPQVLGRDWQGDLQKIVRIHYRPARPSKQPLSHNTAPQRTLRTSHGAQNDAIPPRTKRCLTAAASALSRLAAQVSSAARSGSAPHPGPAPAGVPRETPPHRTARRPTRRRAACPSSPSRRHRA